MPGVHVSLRVGDALALRPQWGADDAAHFLHIGSDQIAMKMLKAGTLELARLIQVAERLVDEQEQRGA